ncbi:hypothetical protein [Pontiella agarivorans]|uniref:Glycosyl transferase n=1 Tax=Pontiella agarivorans TaxID=3038953 RepID=A0ABU5N201_9BACT|nr:hypothetical protein [Pontiella agarivorans]MDZ8120454.1 hypothetical protein [Pontiella agarivorans]
MKKIAYYITAHGYGHGARSCDILNALKSAAPEVPILVKTDLPVEFMKSRLLPGIELRPGAFDVGLIQNDSIQVDLEASIQALTELYSREEELIQQERRFLRDENISTVVADIPAIPLAAAQQEQLPNIGCSNFGWNWIYSEFAEIDKRWQVFVDKFAQVYSRTDLLLRQPFSEPMDAFPKKIDLPLLAKPGTPQRNRIARAAGADPAKPWVLLSFTSLNLDLPALKKISHLRRCEIFTVEPLDWSPAGIHCLTRDLVRFADIVASVDVVVTKPGFGIVSECIANNKPIIYSDRKNFLEYPVLVEAIERYCRHAFIPNAELYSGDLERALIDAESAPEPPEKMPGGGAESAADHILRFAGKTSISID